MENRGDICYMCEKEIVNYYGELFGCLCCSHNFCLDCVITIFHFYADLSQMERDKIDAHGRIQDSDHWCPCYFREALFDVSGCLSSKDMKKIVTGSNNKKY